MITILKSYGKKAAFVDRLENMQKLFSGLFFFFFSFFFFFCNLNRSIMRFLPWEYESLMEDSTVFT